jgi:N-methylhydantoinase B
VLSGKGPKFPQSEGLAGGFPGAANDYIWVHGPNDAHNANRFATALSEIPGDKEPISWGVFPLMGNDALYVRWNGGGGVGDPLQREPAKVLADVVDGRISGEAASQVYGVVLATGGIDAEGTRHRREEMRRLRAPRSA